MLQFGAHPSDSLPVLISSFANPVHLDGALFETYNDSIVEDDGVELREVSDTVAPIEDSEGDGIQVQKSCHDHL